MKTFLQGKLNDANTVARSAHYLFQLRKNQWKKRQELRKIQVRRLRAIITYAYYNVPYYHRIFNSVKIKPEQITDLEDLQKIPVTTKSDVQSNYRNIIPNDADLNKCTVSFTSGSTGIPLKVVADSEARYHSIALLQYAFFECGLRLRDKFVQVKIHLRNDRSVLKPPIGIGFLGRTRLSWVNSIEENIRLLKRIRPDALYTFPSILWQLAKEVRKNQISEINPKLIFSHAEILTPRCIQLVNSTFDTTIHNLYGSVEFNRLAFSCNRDSGLHMITDTAVIETIKDGENVGYDETGEIVVTGLYNYVMPLIRYELGDVGVKSDESCDCGRSWPLIKQIEGRSDDFLILPSGQAISPLNLVDAMEPRYVKGVLQYQIVQEKRNFFVVKVVVNQEFNRKQIFIIQKRIKLRCLGEEVNVDVQVVNEIAKDETGKFRPIISKVVRAHANDF